MIESLNVKGLNGRKIPLNLKFNPDLNLFTGKNGSSKTTILKMVWYMNSGRILNLVKEVNFDEAELITSEFSLKVIRNHEDNSTQIYINNDKKGFPISDASLREIEYRRPANIHLKLSELQKKGIPTLFFPTFRRIEGGFSIEEGYDPRYGYNIDIREALENFSKRMSKFNHTFITSISTDDIVNLLTKEYSNITERISKSQKKRSDDIIDKIRGKRENADLLLVAIQSDIEEMEAEREQNLKPYTLLSELITKIFQNKGISLKNLTLGEVNNSISSDKLSAGEKQMLSFVCYNTFVKNHTIFIDEPELSLHPDWQRTLVPTLLGQESSNQFFMATHSPFIFSKYSDKEIILSNDKGE